MKIRTIHSIGLLGGLITSVLGAIALFVGSRAVMIEQFGRLGIYYGIWTIGIGILLLVGTSLVQKEKRSKVGAILLIIFGIAGMATLTGWFVGPLLGLIAGISAIKRKR